MKQQDWFCEACKTSGTVKFGMEEADVSSVLHLIEGNHRRQSPTCPNPIGQIRVVNHAMQAETFRD